MTPDAMERRVMVEMTVREFLRWQVGTGEVPFDGISTAEAEAIMGDGFTPRDLRRLATRWLKMQESGVRPPVRVTRTSGAPNAHWRFDRSDLRAYAERDPDAGPQLHTDDPNDPAAIASDYLHRNAG